MTRTVFGLFDDVLVAQRVAVALERDGFEREGISLLAPDPRGRYANPGPNSGGARRFKAVAIDGLGAAAVAGPLIGVLGGSGSIGGGLVESLTRIGFPEPEARHYFESLRRGQALIAVESTDERIEDAVAVMRRLGARAVDETTMGAPSTEPEPAPPAAAAPPMPMPIPEAVVEEPAEEPVDEPEPVSETAPASHHVTVPVVEEQLEIGKRQVHRGGIRIQSRIVEEPVEESVSLREERLVVERRPVYREATEADLADFKEGTIEIHETIEEPVITKRRRVVEEIVVGRETRERTETISDTVRRTQVNVEQLPSPETPRATPERNDPAHRHASALARDERFRNAAWSDVEPHARREWERQNAGPWEQAKDAVRSAWNKIHGR